MCEVYIAVLGQNTVVLYADAAQALDVYAGLNGDGGAGYEGIGGPCGSIGRLVNIKPEAVTQGVTEALAIALGGDNVAGDFVNDNTLTVYIKRLREKIEDDPQKPEIIKTVRGLGYRVD